MVHYKLRVKDLENEKPLPQATDSLGEDVGGGLLSGAVGLLGLPCGRKPGRKEHFRCSALTGPPLHIPGVQTSLLPQTPPTQSSFIR